MANKLLNVRMDQEMIEDLKKVCGELEISVTDAIKLFSNKLITERTLPTEEKKEDNRPMIEGSWEIFQEKVETGLNQEKYIQLHNELSNILSFYCKEFANLIVSITTEPFDEIEKTFKEKYEDELKNKIFEKITNFYIEYYNFKVEENEKIKKMFKEMEEKEKEIENNRYIDVMENLKSENPDLYRKLLNKYSYNLTSYEVSELDCKNYNDAKKKLEEFLTPEEIKEYYAFNSEIFYCQTEKEKEKVLENFKKDEKKFELLETAIKKFKEYKNKKNSQNQSETNNNSEEK